MLYSKDFKYNLIDYIELLEKDKNLKQERSSLRSVDYASWQKLMVYQIRLEDQIYYNNRDKYKILIQYYLANIISYTEFVVQFFRLFKENGKGVRLLECNRKELKSMKIDSNSLDFAKYITELFELCEFNMESELQLTEDVLKDKIKGIYLKLK